jgi:hypothetical protein
VNLVTNTTTGNSCLRVITRSWDATDACGNHSATRTQVITVRDTQGPTIGQAGADATINCPSTPSFTAPTASDACNGATVNLVSNQTVQSGVNGAYTVTRVWDATDACGNHSVTRSQKVTVLCNGATCTYTQGYYGSTNGNSCDGTNTFDGAVALITSLLANGGDLIVGRPGWEVIVPNSAAGAIKLNSVMPGGHTPVALTVNSNCLITLACFDNNYLTKQLRINNVLLSQTITLSLNLRMPSSPLGTFPIQNGWLATQKRTGCGQGATTVSCANNAGAIQSFQINANVVNYLTNFGGNTATVNDLLALANDVLGHVLVPGTPGAHGNTVPSFADVNDAVDAINNAFDGCRQFIGYFNCAVTCANIGFVNPCVPPVIGGGINTTLAIEQVQKLNVSAYPNPYNDQVRFVIESPVSGQGSLDVYNMLGQKLQTVYSGYIFAGRGQSVEYKVPAFNRTNLVYILRVGDQQVTGKLLRLEQ